MTSPTNPGDLMDDRPIIDPDSFSYRALGDHSEMQTFVAEMLEMWPDLTLGRFTVISPEHDDPPYPHGWYFEGWKVDPALQTPPGRQGPFNFPLTKAVTDDR